MMRAAAILLAFSTALGTFHTYGQAATPPTEAPTARAWHVGFQLMHHALFTVGGEWRWVQSPAFELGGTAFIGLQENGDEYTGEFATYCLQPGIVARTGPTWLKLETGAFTSLQRSDGESWATGHISVGLHRHFPDAGIGLSLLYSPTVWKSDQDRTAGIPVGVRVVVDLPHPS